MHCSHLNLNMSRLQAERLGHYDGHDGASTRPDILRPRRDHDGSIGIDCERARRRVCGPGPGMKREAKPCRICSSPLLFLGRHLAFQSMSWAAAVEFFFIDLCPRTSQLQILQY